MLCSLLPEVETMAKLKAAAQVCEMLLLLAGITLLCSTESFKGDGKKQKSLTEKPDPDDFSSWGVGS
jgi:hypothetical protein